MGMEKEEDRPAVEREHAEGWPGRGQGQRAGRCPAQSSEGSARGACGPARGKAERKPVESMAGPKLQYSSALSS